jgi:hypothetical protein
MANDDSSGKVADEVKPERSEAADPISKHWAVRLAKVMVPSILSAALAYTGASETSRTQADVVKDKAESGYQFSKEAIAELREANQRLADHVVKLQADVVEIRRQAKLSARRRASEAAAGVRQPVPLAALPAPLPAPSAPLPPNLDKALVQQQQQMGAAAGAAPPPTPK